MNIEYVYNFPCASRYMLVENSTFAILYSRALRIFEYN